jgi:DNA polymerase
MGQGRRDTGRGRIPGVTDAERRAALEAIAAEVRDCTRCRLHTTRTRAVPGEGDASTEVVFVGEGPGQNEDREGRPFVGRAGGLLVSLLGHIGWTRDDVFITNIVKCRPPGNRDPEPDEVEACRPYLDRQISLVKPRLIVALGRVAAQRLLDTDAPLSKLRGPLYHYGPEETPVLITYHPAYLLRSPGEKAKSWQDLKRVSRFLRESA